MSARLDVGQLFVVGFTGTSVPPSARDLFVEHGVGGAILFKRNIVEAEQVVALNTELFEIGRRCASPLLVSVDQEGGRVARLRGIATDVPAMRVVGKAAEEDPELPYRLGAMMARELSALGFHWDFAPVVDVDTNPKNPVIGERSFSRDAAVVGRIAARFIAGMQGAGVAACAKHFPGHGDTDVDSHLALPRLPHSLQRLRDVELVPFVQAREAGVASVMTAHVLFPALDAHEPATLSKAILSQLLRDEVGYDGVCVSDDLEMNAVAERYPVEVLVEKGLNAGCDLFLVCHDNEKAARAVEAVHTLVDSGAVPRARVEQALARVAALKAKYVGMPAAPSMADVRALVRSAPHTELADRLARVTVAGPERGESLVDVG
jgi:beta-N-acetylhexosaminidase